MTERRRHQDALREAEDRFRSAFDEAPIGMAMNSLDGRFLRVNQALCEITGYSREQLEATTYRSITHPDDLARQRDGHRRGDRAGACPTTAPRSATSHADGHVIPVDLSSTLVRDGRRRSRCTC